MQKSTMQVILILLGAAALLFHESLGTGLAAIAVGIIAVLLFLIWLLGGEVKQ